jgi:hypothetical protein
MHGGQVMPLLVVRVVRVRRIIGCRLLSGNAVAFIQPAAKVDQLAAFRAERPPLLFRTPFNQ